MGRPQTLRSLHIAIADRRRCPTSTPYNAPCFGRPRHSRHRRTRRGGGIPVLSGRAVSTEAAAQSSELPVITRDGSGQTIIRATRITTPPRVDGRLDDAAYREVPPITDFIQQEPREGEPVTERDRSLGAVRRRQHLRRVPVLRRASRDGSSRRTCAATAPTSATTTTSA